MIQPDTPHCPYSAIPAHDSLSMKLRGAWNKHNIHKLPLTAAVFTSYDTLDVLVAINSVQNRKQQQQEHNVYVQSVSNIQKENYKQTTTKML